MMTASQLYACTSCPRLFFIHGQAVDWMICPECFMEAIAIDTPPGFTATATKPRSVSAEKSRGRR